MPDDTTPPPTTNALLAQIQELRALIDNLKTAAASADGEAFKALRAELADARQELRDLQAKVNKASTPRPERGFLDLF